MILFQTWSLRSGIAGCCWCSTIAGTSSRRPRGSLSQSSKERPECTFWRPATGGWRSAPPRHRTLRATLDWSYENLSENERVVLRRLAIFAGGFTLDDAAELAADAAIPKGELINLVAELIDKSLVVVEQTASEP